ncbi:flagellin N-terminal helical domain-containing protein [Caproiciproducens faecalis]|uniref:Flagellin n=1 Tax=Caproiciproducens faecalis TaxID=2820301 RepID=A0ABS7DPU5_9FIRM|nr:flagellin [Caproiciproducens faecalis]MBW7573337.1 flagellin protein [Caproiciproducens faecalis]
MRIQHNIAALNANRMLANNNNSVSKNLEKLSSGYKINRAGDDAAGLAISEKMRGQIRGLDQATNNANDGISLVQTAEGALNETASILQRMKELATQSSNGTYQNDVDRENIQKEVDSLKSEIDRIATSTNFNKINLLDGSLDVKASATGTNVAGTNLEANTAGAANGTIDVTGLEKGSTVKFVFADATTTDAKNSTDGATWDANTKTLTFTLTQNDNGGTVGTVRYTAADLNDMIAKAGGPKDAEIAFTSTDKYIEATAEGTADTVDAAISDIIVQGPTKATVSGAFGNGFSVDVSAGSLGITKLTFASGANPSFTGGATPTLTLSTSKDYTASDINALLKENGVKGVTVDFDGSQSAANVVTGLGAAGGITLTGGTGGIGGSELALQIGASAASDQQVKLSVGNMSTEGLGLTTISVATQDDAKAAIETISDAINQVSGTRADLGALQNRLEHTVTNLGVTSENLTSAESRIRDVDMAKEMMEMTKNNVLAQAAQSMLAQANTQPQNVLKLLQ